MDSDGRTPHPPTHYSHPASSQPTSHPDCQTASVKVRVYIEAHRQTKNQKGRLDVRRAPRPRRGPRWRGGPRRTARRETASSRRGGADDLGVERPVSQRGSTGPRRRGGPRRTARTSAEDEAAARARSQARSNWKLHARRNGKKGKTRTYGRVRDLGTFKLQTACLTEAWPRGYGGRVDVGAVKKELLKG